MDEEYKQGTNIKSETSVTISLVMCFLLSVLFMLDGILTIQGLTTGKIEEGNLIIKSLWATFGGMGLITFKLAIILCFFSIFAYAEKNSHSIKASVLFGVLAISEAIIIGWNIAIMRGVS